MKKKETKRGEEKGRKKRTKRELFKEDVTVFVSMVALEIFGVEGEIWRVAVILLGKTFWISLTTCLIVSLRLGCLCRWCLM